MLKLETARSAGLEQDTAGTACHQWNGEQNGRAERQRRSAPARQPRALDAEVLRQVAWEIGTRRAVDAFQPAASHVGIASVLPHQGFAHWHILHDWVEQTRRHKGAAWNHCRLVLRIYDVSYIIFNGMNANQIQDHPLPALSGQLFFKLPRPGAWHLAEVGFVLRSGEFLPAARSQTVKFAADVACGRSDQSALFVDEQGRVHEVANIWDQERILHESRQPKVRHPLRIAALALSALEAGHEGIEARFVSELAAGQASLGHEVHVFLPASTRLNAPLHARGVQFHPLEVSLDGAPVARAHAFAQTAEKELANFPAFDLIHLHEWMPGVAGRISRCPKVLSLNSLEATRRNGSPPTVESLEIERAESDVAQAVDCILTPDWLRERAIAELGVDSGNVSAFPMEGRMPNEWECPLDYGQVKKEIGFGPLDRMMIFIGPLEHSAGVDVLLEALPTVLRRSGNVRVAFAGGGNMHGSLQHRAHELGVAYAVRFLGHVERPHIVRLLRSSEALLLPSRYRVPLDDAVVDLARRAGRPVVTTHGGPAHLVKHEETGLVTYDNPGSMVWALDRILGNPGHAERMGANGKRHDGGALVWDEVARHYLELCAARFTELTTIQA